MKRVALALCAILTPASGWAQSCASCGPYTITGSITACCGPSEPSFATIHKWVVKAPGSLELSGTKFTVAYNATTYSYELSFDGKPIPNEALLTLMVAERHGVDRAQEMESAGLALK